VIQFQRQKLAHRGSGGMTCMRIGPRLQGVLDQLPREGDLFPKIKQEYPKHRAAEFRRRCRTLKIEGRTLHSYRYAWAQRARVAGMPERDAMNHSSVEHNVSETLPNFSFQSFEIAVTSRRRPG